MADIRFALRQFLKNPGFIAVAVLTLALGIGATTAIVSVVKTAVFDPLPVPHSEQLVQLGVVHEERGWYPGINPLVLPELRQETNLFVRVASYDEEGLTLDGEEFPQPVGGLRVSAEFFGLWNVRPLLGRTFAADEARSGNSAAIVISHGLWQRQFGGDPGVLGRAIRFREGSMTVVGVMPAHFSFPRAGYEYWRAGPDPATESAGPNTRAVAEMRPGVGITQVQAFLDVLSRRQRSVLVGLAESGIRCREAREMFSKPEVRRTLGLLLVAIAFVLLIAAANVANLQLARTETRQQEFAARAAMGASRARVFRQLLTESLLLAALGGAGGLVVATFGLDVLQRLIPPDLPRTKPIALDAGALTIASAVTLATGLLCGLAPAWQGRRADLSEVLKLGAATSTRDRARGAFSRTLIVGQVALALALLAGAGLMVRSVIGLLHVNPGFDSRNVVRVYGVYGANFQATRPDGLPDIESSINARFAFLADAQQRIEAVPGVVAVGVAIDGREVEVRTAPGMPHVRMKKCWIDVERADPLRVLRVPLKAGRWLDRGDSGDGARRVLVNETAARQLWPGERAVGKRFWQKGPLAFWSRDSQAEVAHEVVGVVGDTLDYTGKEAVVARYHESPRPIFYRALEAAPSVELAEPSLIVRSVANPATLYEPIGRALKAAYAGQGRPAFYNLHEVLRGGMAGHLTVMLYLSIFAGVGLLLAAIGLYGVLAYNVARRTREIGIRMALGARIVDVMRLIVGQGLVLVAMGGVIGTIVALATARVLRAYLFGVSSTDPTTFIAVASLLSAVAMCACWLPARTAANVDPMEALRHE